MTGEPNDHTESNAALRCAREFKQNSRPDNHLASEWDFQSAEVAKREGAFLPHWSATGATYAVTFRLADSLPRVVLESFLPERLHLLEDARSNGRELTTHEFTRLRKLHSARIEAFLDSGKGECVLRNAEAAQVVKNALHHIHSQRYDILAWCVMPNHVHVVVRPRPGHGLPAILQSWKSFTATSINKLLGRTGKLWQAEYFDDLIRDADDLEHSIRYVLENPKSAGLSNWPWSGTSLDCGIRSDERDVARPSRP
jgi:menaquinone-specific isochorismate synthase